MIEDLEKSLESEMKNTPLDKATPPKRGSNKDEIREVSGFKPLTAKSVPSELMFNDPATTIKIRSASLAEVKYYSSMDEEDPNSIDDGIMHILKSCVKVGGGNYKDLTLTDKLHVFFAVRDYTMMNNSSKNEVIMDFVSQKDGERISKKVESSLFEHYDIDKKLMKYYDEAERCFIIPMSDDSSIEPIKIFVPKIGVVDGLKKYIQKRQSERQMDTSAYVDKKFAIYAQYLVPDWRLMDDDHKYLDTLKKAYDDWDAERLQVFDYAVGLLKTGIKPSVSIAFENGEVERFPMSFREYKSLFFVSDKLRLLFPVD